MSHGGGGEIQKEKETGRLSVGEGGKRMKQFRVYFIRPVFHMYPSFMAIESTSYFGSKAKLT